MKYLYLLAFLPCVAKADFHMFTLQELSLTGKVFKEGSRDPLIDDAHLENREIGQEVSLNMNIDVAGPYLYWNNHVLSYTDRWTSDHRPGQFRLVGWEFEVGARPFEWLEVGYYHFSKHLLDYEYPTKFPVLDAGYIKLIIYKK
jgi:hypothetical protein